MSFGLTKYVLICITFQKKSLNISTATLKNLVLFCRHRVESYYRGDLEYLLLSFHKLENTFFRQVFKNNMVYKSGCDRNSEHSKHSKEPNWNV